MPIASPSWREGAARHSISWASRGEVEVRPRIPACSNSWGCWDNRHPSSAASSGPAVKELLLGGCDALVEDSDHRIDLLGGHDERRGESGKIIAASQQETPLARLPLDRFSGLDRGRKTLARVAALDELHTLQQARPTHVADDRESLRQAHEALAQPFSLPARVADDV